MNIYTEQRELRRTKALERIAKNTDRIADALEKLAGCVVRPNKDDYISVSEFNPCDSIVIEEG